MHDLLCRSCIRCQIFGWCANNGQFHQLWRFIKGKPCNLQRWSHRAKLMKIAFWTTFISTKTLYHWNWMRCFLRFLKIMEKTIKTAITFFPMGGFLGILDMLFYATWPTIGDNAAWRTFFSTSKPNYTRLYRRWILGWASNQALTAWLLWTGQLSCTIHNSSSSSSSLSGPIRASFEGRNDSSNISIYLAPVAKKNRSQMAHVFDSINLCSLFYAYQVDWTRI